MLNEYLRIIIGSIIMVFCFEFLGIFDCIKDIPFWKIILFYVVINAYAQFI
jgi:hypothetical protein